MKIEELKTPAFVIDLARLERNVRMMRDRASALGVRLRPHVKTHKTVEIARMQTAGGPEAITVSTLAEARFFARAGFGDITYAVPITPNKLPEAAALTRELDAFHVLVDHPVAADAVEACARAEGIVFSVFLKVDAGNRRAGVDPASEGAADLARRLHESGTVAFQGILVHGGQSYACRGRDAIVAAAEEERSGAVGFAKRLRATGVPCPCVSIGSTPTAVHAASATGADEIRPGNYVFFDATQAAIGTCTLDDCAAYVTAGVAGVYPDRNCLIIDAGALALSKDPGAVFVRQDDGFTDTGGTTFGAVVGYPQLAITSLSQEHGVIESGTPIPCEDFPIGRVVRIIPNHSCLTAALFPVYHVARDEEIVDEWIPVRGW